jgi:hypothetical protein
VIPVRAWSELTPEEQFVLRGADENDLLLDLLTGWAPDGSWPDRLTEVPRLAAAIVRLVQDGAVEVWFHPSWGLEPELLTADRVQGVVEDPDNWWTEEGPRYVVELARGAG